MIRNRKRIILISCLIQFTGLFLYGQTIDYNQIILPQTARDVTIEEKLVQIAWNNLPDNRILENNLDVQKANITLARWFWLDDFQFTSNLNEFVLTGQTELLPTFYPRYNLMIRVRFGQFVSVPVSIKREKILYENEVLKMNKQKITLRTEVLIRYQKYKLAKEQLSIQTRLSEDVNTQFLIVEQEFKNGNITFDEYNNALKQNYAELSKKVSSMSQYEISKIELEEMLGTKIEYIEGVN